MTGEKNGKRVSVKWLTEAVTKIFVAAGLSDSAASKVASSLVDADRRGISSHGVMLVPMYIGRIRHGSVSKREKAEVVVDSNAIALLDAHHALGQLTGDQAMELAVEKARRYGVGAVTVRHAFHFGGAFRYVQRAAKSQCIGIAAANTRPLMPATGGARPVLGNNPLAVGVPNGDKAPIVLDMALSEAALGKIRIAASEGKKIPPTWATDSEGKPTTDPQAALEGMLLPIGGHKGYGLALIVDILAGVLSGGSSGDQVKGLYTDFSTPNDCAHVFLAIHIASFCDFEDFLERLQVLTLQIKNSPRAPGVERIMLPGEIEEERFAQSEERGVVIARSILEDLERTADEMGVRLGSE